MTKDDCWIIDDPLRCDEVVDPKVWTAFMEQLSSVRVNKLEKADE